MITYNFQNFKIEILYEDSDIAILNKPYGLLTHKKNMDDSEASLCESIKERFNILDDEPFKEGIVHRLDKNTSGLIIIAKDKIVKSKLQQLFKDRNINKFYTAYSLGNFINKDQDVINNISRDTKKRTKFKVSIDKGKISHTKIKHIETFFGSISLLECNIITGRTHQIRVHLSELGFPLIGDINYQKNIEKSFVLKNLPSEIGLFINKFPRQALHSSRIIFTNPVNSKEIDIKCDLPEDLIKLDNILRND